MKSLLSCWICAIAASLFAPVAVGEPATQEREEELEKKTAQQIDLYTANLFHKRLARVCSNNFVGLTYAGPLRYEARIVRRSPGPPSNVLNWQILQWDPGDKVLDEKLNRIPPRIVCDITLSTEKRADTVATCTVNGKKLHLRARMRFGDLTLDSKIPEKDISVRALLNRFAAARD